MVYANSHYIKRDDSMKDKLFISTSPKRFSQNAVVGGFYSEPYIYIEGYYKASEFIISSALNDLENSSDLTFLFHPILFNYRHYVELHLKHLIKQTENLYSVLKELDSTRGELRESVTDQLTNTHRLNRLLDWLIERVQLVTDETLDKKILETIRQLDEMDPDGQNFRYAFRTNGKQSLPKQISTDIEIIRKRMVDVHNDLSWLDIWLHEEIQSACEFLYEYQREFQDYY